MAHEPAHKLAARLDVALRRVPSGTRWMHTGTGGQYRVAGVVLDEATARPLVVYAGPDDVAWARPLDVFIAKFRRIDRGR